MAFKNRDLATGEWQCWSPSLGGNQWSLRFNSNAARADFNAWNNTAPNNNHVVLGPVTSTNGNGDDIIAYCWTAIPGYSAFGTYNGNGLDDGTFVYTGFKVAFLLTKAYTRGSTNWQIRDTTRSPTNPNPDTLYPDLFDKEYSGGNADVDFLSNGFKMRNGDTNVNGTQMLYIAFAENPFGGSNVSPVTAR